MRKPIIIVITIAENDEYFTSIPNVKSVQPNAKLHVTGKFASHNTLITQNGKVYVWGYNGNGELGIRDLWKNITPTENTQLEQIIQDNGGVENILTLKTGEHHNILIFKNGKIYVWGDNKNGQLGLGDATDRDAPTENSELEQVIQENGGVDNILTLETGVNHNILIFKNGKVYVWGYNDDGQLGLGDTIDRDTPTENTQLEQIIQDNGGIDNILTLETGYRHNILIFKNGKVYVWGGNWNGQLGTRDWWKRDTPTENTQLEQIIQDNGGVNNILTLETGGDHNILVFKNGKVYVWGDNSGGQLGLRDWWDRDTLWDRYTPTENTQLEQIIQENGGVDNILTFKTGVNHNILIFKNGKVYVWGYNEFGQLGLGDWWSRITPTENSKLERIIQENGGVENILTLETGEDHNILVFKNGRVYVWGWSKYGQLGLGYRSNSSPYEILTPTENSKLEQIIRDNGGVENILTLETGRGHNILIFKNGKVYVWGANGDGQLGLGYKSTYGILTPTKNSQLERIIQENGGADNILTLETGAGHNILIFKNGKVYVWGRNYEGQLGLGYISPCGILRPTENLQLDQIWDEGVTPTENTQLEQIIQDNGGADNILTLETGEYHNILIFKNGKAYVWGYNKYGQLGLGDRWIEATPTENLKLEQIIQQNGGVENILTLETGGDHNILVFKNGKVYVWGYNEYGQLGIGDTNDRNTPTENSKLEQIIQENGGTNNILMLETGEDYNILIFKNGKVYVWGYNDDGQLGTSDNTNRNTPTENTQLEQIIQDNGGVNNILTIETSWGHNILIFKNGKVYVWGRNGDGQLGLGVTTNRNTPTENSELEQIIQENGGVFLGSGSSVASSIIVLL